jgi:outer membrane protein
MGYVVDHKCFIVVCCMKIVYSLLFFIGSIASVGAQSSAEEPTSFSLKEAIDYCMNNSFTVKNSLLQRNMTAAKKGEVRSLLLPQVSGNADFNHFFQVQKNILEGGIGFMTSAAPGTVVPLQLSLPNQLLPSLSASQVLFDMAYFSGYKAANASEVIADQTIRKSRIDMTVNVTKAYYGVLVNEKQLKAIHKNLERMDSLYQETVARYETGLARRIDVSRMEVSLNNMREEREKTIRAVELSRSILRYQMNLPESNPMILTDSLSEDVLAEVEQILSARQKVNYSNRIEYSILESQKRLSQIDRQVARAGHYPRLYAVASTGFTPSATKIENLTQSSRWHQYSSVGLRLQVPIFSGFGVHYKVQQKKIEEEIIDNNKVALEKGINLEVDQALINLENSMQSLKIQKRNLDLAEENLQVLRAEYEQGIALNIEVTTAEAALIDAQTNYYHALFGALISKADYDKAVGNIVK